MWGLAQFPALPTPMFITNWPPFFPFTNTICVLSFRYESITLIPIWFRPVLLIFIIKIEWSQLSKAFETSKNMLTTCFLLARSYSILFTNLITASSVLCCCLKLNWLSSMNIGSIISVSCLFIIFSKTFDITGSRAIGL
jgi:hypothetical protein